MIQEIITYCIVAIAVVAALYRLAKAARSLYKKLTCNDHVAENSGNCAGCTTGCELKNLPSKRNCHPTDGNHQYILH